MAKAKEKQPDLPGVEGDGVAPVRIKEIDQAITKYERAKEKRCAESPKEVAAKQSLRALLHENRDNLSLNEDGQRFYRSEGVDYILEESLRRRKVDDGSGDE